MPASMDCAPRVGQVFELRLTGSGLSEGEGRCRDGTAGRLRRMELKRRVVAEYKAGETLHGLSRRHDVCRNLIRIWIAKAEAGAFDGEVAAAALLVRYEARIASLERLVGQQALELSFIEKGGLDGPSPASAPASVIAGPAASPSKGGAS
jgi:transposase